ncbi:MAG: hypothetical protein SGPRY_006242 [Prymnesium sp.]
MDDQLGLDTWRASVTSHPPTKNCPNECRGRGSCAYGFCHCDAGWWGLDCGMSLARVKQLRRHASRPRIFVYEVPVGLRRSCGPWRLSEELGDAMLSSDHLEPDPTRADLFWIYGCPNGDTILPMLSWIKLHLPYWNASVRAGSARHVLTVGHEEGWSEVWALLGRLDDSVRRWLASPLVDHSNRRHSWDDLHPASPTRQLISLQLSGKSDYMVNGHPIRGVSSGAPCRICFQPDKDVMIPGFPGIMDYPDDTPKLGLYGVGHDKVSECQKIARESAYQPDGEPSPRTRRPKVFFTGVVQTKTHGPGLYEPSRLVFYSCWKNRSAENDFFIRQTESVLISVNSWEVEKPVNPLPYTRQASFCIVPEGKIGSYGHRMSTALQLGCIPVFTKEILDASDSEKLRRAIADVRRRLLWTSLYGSCHLGPDEGGQEDAFDTLMQESPCSSMSFAVPLNLQMKLCVSGVTDTEKTF